MNKILPKKCRKVEKAEFGFICSQCISVFSGDKFFCRHQMRNIDAALAMRKSKLLFFDISAHFRQVFGRNLANFLVIWQMPRRY